MSWYESSNSLYVQNNKCTWHISTRKSSKNSICTNIWRGKERNMSRRIIIMTRNWTCFAMLSKKEKKCFFVDFSCQEPYLKNHCLTCERSWIGFQKRIKVEEVLLISLCKTKRGGRGKRRKNLESRLFLHVILLTSSSGCVKETMLRRQTGHLHGCRILPFSCAQVFKIQFAQNQWEHDACTMTVVSRAKASWQTVTIRPLPEKKRLFNLDVQLAVVAHDFISLSLSLFIRIYTYLRESGRRRFQRTYLDRYRRRGGILLFSSAIFWLDYPGRMPSFLSLQH